MKYLSMKNSQKPVKVFLWFLLILPLFGCQVSNEPLNADLYKENILITSYQETPKYLDSTSSYSNNETPWTYAIYEPPLRYHYLKRPYALEPRSLEALPKVSYVDAQGRALPDTAPIDQISQSIFELRIKQGILWQPHPAFARDPSGAFLYHRLNEDDLEPIKTPYDFKHIGSRELTADDYVYSIRRLATTRVKSPAFGFLSEKIVGLAEYGKSIRHQENKLKAELGPRQSGPFGHMPWLDFRKYDFPGVQKVDKYTLRIRLNGKYPQFKYWLAMTFFAPLAWEVDAFYSQPGMSERNLTLNTWPVGTGPFMLTEFVPNARMVLKRNPNFRRESYPCEGEMTDQSKGLLEDCGKPIPFVDGMISIRENEGTSVHTKFIQGYYDNPQIERGEPGITYQVSIDDNTGRSRDLIERKIQLPSTIQVGLWYFGFNWLDPVVGAGNTQEQAIKNRKLRQALAIAFDFEEYVAVFEQNRAKVNHSIVVPGLFGNDQIGPNPLIYDIDRDGKVKRKSIDIAKRLLSEAGYPNGRDAKTGKPLVLNYDTQGVGPGHKARLDWTIKQAAKLNIQMELRNTDYNRFQDKMRKGSAQFFFWGWLADYPDPENFLFLLYGPNSKAKFDGENASNWTNKEFDKLFLEMKDLQDGPERAEIIRKMGSIMQEDMPLLYGWSEEYGGAYHQWVHNAKPSNIIRDSLLYLKIEPDLRARKIKEWNHPIWWPLLLAPVLMGLVAWPAWASWRRRQNSKALIPELKH